MTAQGTGGEGPVLTQDSPRESNPIISMKKPNNPNPTL